MCWQTVGRHSTVPDVVDFRAGVLSVPNGENRMCLLSESVAHDQNPGRSPRHSHALAQDELDQARVLRRGRGGNQGSWVIYFDRDEWIDPIAIWHNNSSTFAYADGHAEHHKWVGKGTRQMAENQTFFFKPNPASDSYEQDIEDLRYMQKGYAHLGNR